MVGSLAGGLVLCVGFVLALLESTGPSSAAKSAADNRATTTQPTNGSVAPSSTTVSTVASPSTTEPLSLQLSVGQAGTFTRRGQPDFSITLAQVADPAQPSGSSVTTGPGARFVAFDFTLTDTGSGPVTLNTAWEFRLYDSSDNGYASDGSGTDLGPAFPSTNTSLAPGTTATGWVVFLLPRGSSKSQLIFTPGFGYDEIRALWSLS